MVRLDWPGYWRETLPSGAARHRVRVASSRRKITIPVGPGHPAFSAHYHAARRGEIIDTPRAPTATPRSVEWLVQRFDVWMRDQMKAGHLHPATVKQRRAFLARFVAAYGDKRMEAPRGKLLEWRDSMASTPGAADNAMKAVRAMYAWAVEREIVPTNPAMGIPKIHKGSGGAVPWSADDLRKYRDAHPFGSAAHLALTLFMFTACRISDGVLLGRRHETTVAGVPSLRWRPAKKGSAEVCIPVLPPLRRALDAQVVVGDTYLLTEHGRPYASPEAFRNRFRKWVDAAGLERRTTHGIRKAAGDLLAEAGVSQHGIMAVHGHAVAGTSEVYTRGARRAVLAAEAMRAMEGVEW